LLLIPLLFYNVLNIIFLTSLKSLSGETMPVEVTVIHSQPLLMSVIQVICNEKMVAVAHLIASDQLPLPTQVRNTLFLTCPW
jgi:hypothetical protein